MSLSQLESHSQLLQYVAMILQLKDSLSANLIFRAYNEQIKQNHLKYRDLAPLSTFYLSYGQTKHSEVMNLIILSQVCLCISCLTFIHLFVHFRSHFQPLLYLTDDTNFVGELEFAQLIR